MTTATIDRDWVVSEMLKIIEEERALALDAKARAEAPPLPEMAVFYHEVAEQDERHIEVLETIATRYGHTPSRSLGGGVGETLGRLKDKVATLGSGACDLIRQDLSARSEAIDWRSVWIATFESMNDAESARDLTAVLAEDKAHHEALLERLKRLIQDRVGGERSS
ncbi:MAG: hypothetical protein AB7I30_14100 [Isosphaeraceae bacterium]